MDVRNVGIPVVTFITEPFNALAKMVARSTLGTSDPPVVTLPPVFETLAPEAGRRLADDYWDDIVTRLLDQVAGGSPSADSAGGR
jgi:hypothetical protein